MPFSDIANDLGRAVGFLSRIRIPDRYFTGHDGNLGRAASIFPVAGLIIALPAAVFVLIFSALDANSALLALMALATGIGLTGALHEDGLADCFDAFGAGGDRERTLLILKDSRIGVYGALGLVFSIALRAVALTILFAVTSAWLSAFLVLAVAAWSRAAMVWHWDDLPPARLNGIAASAGTPESGAAKVALATGAVLAFVAGALSVGMLAAILAIALSAGAVRFWTGRVRTRIGGHTGDTIGAAQQLSETVFLLTLALLA